MFGLLLAGVGDFEGREKARATSVKSKARSTTSTTTIWRDLVLLGMHCGVWVWEWVDGAWTGWMEGDVDVGSILLSGWGGERRTK